MPQSSGRWNAIRDISRKLEISDLRDLLEQKCETPSSHCGWRPTPKERAELLRLNEAQANPAPKMIAVIDDVLTTGSHFRAAKMVLRQRWPQMRVVGLFLARVSSHRDMCVFGRAIPEMNPANADL
jgi:predicted amidophosphoribosyltransferase